MSKQITTQHLMAFQTPLRVWQYLQHEAKWALTTQKTEEEKRNVEVCKYVLEWLSFNLYLIFCEWASVMIYSFLHSTHFNMNAIWTFKIDLKIRNQNLKDWCIKNITGQKIGNSEKSTVLIQFSSFFFNIIWGRFIKLYVEIFVIEYITYILRSNKFSI